ncbi:MAG: sigma-70 family RNA polymerase sigma factor [Gemmataceae bacterium]
MPMAEQPTIDDRDLIAAYKAGSESAARKLFDRYCEKLMRLAQRRIGQRMASRIDPEDAVQSAFRTFFARVKNDQFRFEGESEIFKLLVRLTVNKTLRQIAHHRAAKRDPGRETAQGLEDDTLLEQLTADEPLPEVQVALLEEFERFLKQLPEFDREVLQLKFEGYTTTEIAKKLNSYDRKIRRVFERAAALAEGNATDADE